MLRTDLKANSFDYENEPLITPNGFREYDARWQFGKELNLKIILSGATDAWKLASTLKEYNVPVIIGPTMAMPQEPDDPYDAPYANAAKLQARKSVIE